MTPVIVGRSEIVIIGRLDNSPPDNVAQPLLFAPRQPYACWSAASVDLARVLDRLHARQPQSRRRRRIKVAFKCLIQCRRWCRPANNGQRLYLVIRR